MKRGLKWTKLAFGKYKGKTLPHIVLLDPDYFFWAHNKGVFRGMVATEADEIYRRATRIRIPSKGSERRVAEYFLHPSTGRFADIHLVPVSQPRHEGSSTTMRSESIDLSIPRSFGNYDKLGGRLLVRSLKFHLFGAEDARLTARKCEAFFEEDQNFNL